MIRLSVFFVVLAAVMPAPAASAQTHYVLIDLGVVDGVASYAIGINDSGQVGGFVVIQPHGSRAVRSSNGEPFQYVPALQSLEIGTEGINSHGDLTGNVVVSLSPTFSYHAFRYADQGGLVDLGTLGGVSSTGIGINSLGEVAGWSDAASGAPRAFRSRPGQPLEPLGTFGGATSYASGLNDAGQVVGQAQDAVGVIRAFRFTDGQPLLDLGALGGNYGAVANRINASGQVVGYASIPAGGGHAFRYTDGAGMQDLDLLGGRYSEGLGINDGGDVVGDFYQNGVVHAFRYTDQDGMVDLNGLIDANSGWVLNRAVGINRSGQIVGIGAFNGTLYRGFLLTPVVPDIVPPVVSAADANPASLWPANHKMVPVRVSVAATDNVDPSPTCRITAISFDEPGGGSVDFQITGALDALLRAETLGPAGRTYSIIIECSDASSNTASTVVRVRVPHDQSVK